MASVPTLFWANSYDLFVLFVSVSIIFDIHATSDIDNLSCGVLSALPGGRISKLQDLLLNTVKPSTLHVVESKIQQQMIYLLQAQIFQVDAKCVLKKYFLLKMAFLSSHYVFLLQCNLMYLETLNYESKKATQSTVTL